MQINEHKFSAPYLWGFAKNGKFIGKRNIFLLAVVARINIRHGEWEIWEIMDKLKRAVYSTYGIKSY